MERPNRLNQSFVDRVSQQGRYGDGRGSFGLSLLVKETKSGRLSKTYAQRLLIDGKHRTFGLGAHPIIRLSEAREAALENARIARMLNRRPSAMERIAFEIADAKLPTSPTVANVPNGDLAVTIFDDLLSGNNRVAVTPTFGEMAKQAGEMFKHTWTSQNTVSQWEGMMRNHALPFLANKEVGEITSRDVVSVLERLYKDGKEATARRMKVNIERVFEFAIANDWIVSNPATKAQSALPSRSKKPTEHRRSLPYPDMPQAVEALQAAKVQYENTRRGALFLLLTGARRNEMRYAVWNEIDLDARVWIIPAKRTKARREHRVSLSSQAVRLLKDAAKDVGTDSYIFSTKPGKAMGEHTTAKLLSRNGIDSSVHGLRSTFRTWAAEQASDIPREIAEAFLAHVTDSQVERAYRRSDFLDLRVALTQRWADFIMPTR